ncbi:MAG: thioredoxin [Oscillibacter sp.]|jgi:thioredoxin 1|nr:thioredoxin [Oscillibacter sp.]
MSVMTIHTDDFRTSVLESDQPVLVDFWASWCGPCKMIAPVVDQLAQEHPEIAVGRVNVDEETELARQFEIMSIPTLMLFRNGKPVATSVGVRPKAALEAMLR